MNKETIKQELLELADIEAINLKKHAQVEELQNLDFNSLDSHSKNGCIYGQMTGSCNSTRAKELILKCATRVLVRPENMEHETMIANSMKEFILNGKPQKIRKDEIEYVSPIEALIVRYPEYNRKLISFLKGDSEQFLK